MINKVTERQRLRDVVDNLKADYRQVAEQIINAKLEKFLISRKPQDIAIYLNRSDEVSTKHLYEWLVAKGWNVHAPKLEGGDLHFHRIKPGVDEIFWNEKFRIWEPHSANPKAKKISIIIVPLVGYSESNYRLGRGKGYYDRWLQANRPALVIGLAYKEQRVNPQLTFNSKDFPLHLIITNDS